MFVKFSFFFLAKWIKCVSLLSYPKWLSAYGLSALPTFHRLSTFRKYESTTTLSNLYHKKMPMKITPKSPHLLQWVYGDWIGGMNPWGISNISLLMIGCNLSEFWIGYTNNDRYVLKHCKISHSAVHKERGIKLSGDMYLLLLVYFGLPISELFPKYPDFHQWQGTYFISGWYLQAIMLTALAYVY